MVMVKSLICLVRPHESDSLIYLCPAFAKNKAKSDMEVKNLMQKKHGETGEVKNRKLAVKENEL